MGVRNEVVGPTLIAVEGLKRREGPSCSTCLTCPEPIHGVDMSRSAVLQFEGTSSIASTYERRPRVARPGRKGDQASAPGLIPKNDVSSQREVVQARTGRSPQEIPR